MNNSSLGDLLPSCRKSLFLPSSGSVHSKRNDHAEISLLIKSVGEIVAESQWDWCGCAVGNAVVERVVV
jgi:hypothetical protein